MKTHQNSKKSYTCGCSCHGASEKQRKRSLCLKKKKSSRNKKYYEEHKIFIKVKKYLKEYYNTPHPYLDYSSDEAIWLLQNLPLAPHLYLEVFYYYF
jgi:hypothetical protein